MDKDGAKRCRQKLHDRKKREQREGGRSVLEGQMRQREKPEEENDKKTQERKQLCEDYFFLDGWKMKIKGVYALCRSAEDLHRAESD